MDKWYKHLIVQCNWSCIVLFTKIFKLHYFFAYFSSCTYSITLFYRAGTKYWYPFSDNNDCTHVNSIYIKIMQETTSIRIINRVCHMQQGINIWPNLLWIQVNTLFNTKALANTIGSYTGWYIIFIFYISLFRKFYR